MKKNNKGFTLVELLAVIVILAVIMIIATQQVNDLIKKSRMSSFNDSVGVAVKTAKIFIADENLTQKRLRNGMDYSVNEYEVYLTNDAEGHYLLIGAAKEEGKFGKVRYNTDGFKASEKFCYVEDTGDSAYSRLIVVKLDKVTGKQSKPNVETIMLKDNDGNDIRTIKTSCANK